MAVLEGDSSREHKINSQPHDTNQEDPKDSRLRSRLTHTDAIYAALERSSGVDFRQLDMSTDASRQHWREILLKNVGLTGHIKNLANTLMLASADLLSRSESKEQYDDLRRQMNNLRTLIGEPTEE